MSDKETFDVFFHNLSEKIVETYFKEKINEEKLNENKWIYSLNTNSDDIIKGLKNKSKDLSKLLSNSIGISNIRSTKYYFDRQLENSEFINTLKNTTKSFTTNSKLNYDSHYNNTIEFIKYGFSTNSFKKNILNLKDHDNFYDWANSKKEAIVCGYSLVIFLLTFSFYVFLN